MQGFSECVADQIVDGLHIQLGRQPFLYTVDDGEFGSAFLGDLEQALSLVEETRVFERNAHGASQSTEQTQIGVAVRFFTVHVLKRDRSAYFIPDQKRNAQP